jgi:hypothetical protein
MNLMHVAANPDTPSEELQRDRVDSCNALSADLPTLLNAEPPRSAGQIVDRNASCERPPALHAATVLSLDDVTSVTDGGSATTPVDTAKEALACGVPFPCFQRYQTRSLL